MSHTQEFITIKNFIDGQWVEETGGNTVPLYNPSTGEEIGRVPLSSKETSLAAVDSAHAAYDGWRKDAGCTSAWTTFSTCARR